MDQDNSALQIVSTADGSKTIYNPFVGENYHSKHGALQESEHVFLNSGLRYYLADKNVDSVSVLEVGFGTGLNFLLSADYCQAKELKLSYVGLEAYPLSKALLEETGYKNLVSANLWKSFVANYEDSLTQLQSITDFVKLSIVKGDAKVYQTVQKFDVIYFDAFASNHQPELWEEDFIKRVVSFLKPGGVFVTYAITGNLKRTMKALGLQVEKAPGAARKREMLRAVMGGECEY